MKSFGYLKIITGKKENNSEWSFGKTEKYIMMMDKLNNNNINEMLYEKYKSTYFINNSVVINKEFWKE